VVSEEDDIPANVISVSSQVTFGSVGNAVAVPAIERSGLTVLGMPTVVLSNHPGLGKPVSQPVAADVLAGTFERLVAGGWAGRCAGVLTGYFISADQVEAVAEGIAAVKAGNPSCIYLCDPVLGDAHTGLYVPEAVAVAIRQRLVPLADLVTPNAFELAWLSGRPVDDVESAAQAAAALPVPAVVGTSIRSGDDNAVLTVLFAGETVDCVRTARRARVAHGTGDLLAGLLLAAVLGGRAHGDALGLAVAQLDHVIAASDGSLVLDVAGSLAGLGQVAPLPVGSSE
jgi:pyridoxine kinase